MKKYDNFCKALDNLRIVKEVEEPYDILTMTGSVALFEICFEQSWKAMKAILTEHGYAERLTGSPKMIIKLAYSAGMINDEEKWLKMLDSRNDITHSYNEEVAFQIIDQTKKDYICLFEKLKTAIDEKWML